MDGAWDLLPTGGAFRECGSLVEICGSADRGMLMIHPKVDPAVIETLRTSGDDGPYQESDLSKFPRLLAHAAAFEKSYREDQWSTLEEFFSPDAV